MKVLRSRTARAVLGLFLAAAATGCSAARTATPPEAAPVPAPGPDAAEIAEMEAIYRARTDSLRMRFTEADVAFMNGMIHHHAQALEMARLAPTHGASPSIATLAARITNAQRGEIALMQQWLRDRGQPVPELHITDNAIMVHAAAGHVAAGHDSGHGTHMPGMLSDEQIAELKRARGAAFDRLFLTLMIQHHRGAVTMVHQLFGTPGAGQDEEAFAFASDVQVDQSTEVARMERMLAALPPAR